MSRWGEAAGIYSEWLNYNPASSSVVLNFALCLLALGRYAEASKQSARIPVDDPNCWRAKVIYARAQLAEGKVEVALQSLREVLEYNPADVDIALELANTLLQYVGDAAGARQVVAPFIEGEGYREAALQTYIVASLYDRVESDSSLVERILSFAANVMSHSAEIKPQVTRNSHGRMRVGLISGYFCVSPVYFLTYSVLEQLSKKFDLIFYDRGSKKDWAHGKFEGIASEWVDVDQANPDKLHHTLRAGHLDALFEMAGWSDVEVLKAIADRPCPKIFKWVGGQSATTGMTVFDGFISDSLQTPLETQDYYTEPLVNLESGYVAYTPPDYLPGLVQPRKDVLLLGVVGNPVKITASYLEEIAKVITAAAKKIPVPIVLQFIDTRYREKIVCQRISEALRCYFDNSSRVAVLYTYPVSHKDFLTHVGKLSAVIDTWPYSAGLTALEALAMGVPVLGKPGTLCSGRHAVSHQFFATRGLSMKKFSLAGLTSVAKMAEKPRKLAGFAKSARCRPDKVALALGKLIECDSLSG